MPTPWLPLLLLASTPARPSLVVHADACLEIDEAELVEVIELHLGAGPDHRGTSPGQAGDTRIDLDCAADGSAELTVVDPVTNSVMTRNVSMPVLERRSERLGWAAAAQVRAVWMNLVLDPTARPRDPVSRRAARVARRPPSPWQLGDGFAVRGFFDPRSPSLMLGEQVEVVHRPLRHLAWKADGELAYWRVPVEIDGESARINTLTISAAPVLMTWSEFPGRGPRGAGTVAIYGGAGFRVGGVRMRGPAPDLPDEFSMFIGPLAAARVSVSLGRFVRLAVDAEAGWVLGPVHETLSFIGPWANGVIVIVSSF